MDFKNKIVVITASSKGIGKSIAMFFANLGCQIVMTYNTSMDLSNNVKNEITRKYHVHVDNIHCDLKCEEDIINVYKFIENKYHHVDILVNNAGLSLDNSFANKTKKEFMEVLEVNVVGTFLMIKHLSTLMDNNSYIFNISSTDAIDTYSPLNIDYSSSKAAINNMTKNLSLILNSIIISICPNWVNTESIQEMEKNYLKNELKRVNQKELISPELIPKTMYKCIINKIKTGSIIRLDGEKYE